MNRKSELISIETILKNEFPDFYFEEPDLTIEKQNEAQNIKQSILIFLKEKKYNSANLSAICRYIKSIDDTYRYFNNLDDFFTRAIGSNAQQKAYHFLRKYVNYKTKSIFNQVPKTAQLLPDDYYSLLILLYFLYAPMIFQRFIFLNPIEHLSFDKQDLLNNYQKLPEDLQERATLYMQKLVDFSVKDK